VMAAYLIRMRNRAQDRLREQAAEAPAAIAESAGNPAKTVTLYVPNDLDDSLIAVERSIPLPAEENAQARVLLQSLIEAYRAPDSTHPINVSTGVNDVYFLATPQGKGQDEGAGQMAVVDLNGALAAAQPSGIEPETLTLLSMMATLHANLPRVTEVHFLVDGQARETLAGHADLTRTYVASDHPTTPTAGALGAPGSEAERRPSPAVAGGEGR